MSLTEKIRLSFIHQAQNITSHFHILCLFCQVEPFAGIASAVDRSTPRLLVNREIVGPFSRRWERRSNDVVQRGDIVEGVKKLVNLLGWSESMEAIMKSAAEKWKDHSSTRNGNVSKASEELAKSIGKTKEGEEKDKVVQNGSELKKDSSGAQTNNVHGVKNNGLSNGSGLSPFGTRTLHSLTNNGFRGNGVLYRTDKSVLFMRREGLIRQSSSSQRVPLLPFRYSQRKDLNTEEQSEDFKVIDPGKDLASAGFGLGKRTMGLGCFLAGTAGESSSDDD